MNKSWFSFSDRISTQFKTVKKRIISNKNWCKMGRIILPLMLKISSSEECSNLNIKSNKHVPGQSIYRGGLFSCFYKIEL